MGKRTVLRLRVGCVSALLVLGVVVSACSDEAASDAAYDEYYRLLGEEMAAFDREIGTIVGTQEGLDSEGLSASIGADAGQLEFHATALADLDAPGEAAEPHRKFVTAFRYLRDVKILQADQLIGIDSGLSDDELAQRVDRRSSEWFDLCHELQDLALTREIDVDLKCVTALHRPR